MKNLRSLIAPKVAKPVLKEHGAPIIIRPEGGKILEPSKKIA
jgi:hypothetical protein